jgi:hypothetical protein
MPTIYAKRTSTYSYDRSKNKWEPIFLMVSENGEMREILVVGYDGIFKHITKNNLNIRGFLC